MQTPQRIVRKRAPLLVKHQVAVQVILERDNKRRILKPANFETSQLCRIQFIVELIAGIEGATVKTRAHSGDIVQGIEIEALGLDFLAVGVDRQVCVFALTHVIGQSATLVVGVSLLSQHSPVLGERLAHDRIERIISLRQHLLRIVKIKAARRFTLKLIVLKGGLQTANAAIGITRLGHDRPVTPQRVIGERTGQRTQAGLFELAQRIVGIRLNLPEYIGVTQQASAQAVYIGHLVASPLLNSRLRPYLAGTEISTRKLLALLLAVQQPRILLVILVLSLDPRVNHRPLQRLFTQLRQILVTDFLATGCDDRFRLTHAIGILQHAPATAGN
ncbi:hypothetical protein D3C79_671810 [compost metagenome]